jgi:hypothetical protein
MLISEVKEFLCNQGWTQFNNDEISGVFAFTRDGNVIFAYTKQNAKLYPEVESAIFNFAGEMKGSRVRFKDHKSAVDCFEVFNKRLISFEDYYDKEIVVLNIEAER